MATIVTFISDYITSHNLNPTRFSDLVGVSHTTVRRWLNGKATPDLEQLGKLADATGTDICYLVDLIVPGRRREIPATAREIAERIAKLPQDRQELFDALLLGVISQEATKKRKKA